MKGVETIMIETHNFGKTAKFWQALGYTLEFETDHGSGLLRSKNGGPNLFVAERPKGKPLAIELHVRSSDASTRPGPPVEIVGDWHPSHWTTQLLELRDPDGRVHWLEHGDP